MSFTARKPNINTVATPSIPPKSPKKVIAPLRLMTISPTQSIKRPIKNYNLKSNI